MSHLTTPSGDNTPEYVAYLLLLDVALHEGKNIKGSPGNADKNYILETYKESLRAVKLLKPI